ncbi:MAG: bifunctional folylpolyglutamate synthase/dihydrofolate synthase [Sphingobacteriaceae bacterium]|nr:bifunctional folylpolyglutamate synthase/dihydrofolate synthase [Sphingobacteriaceae bacterium]
MNYQQTLDYLYAKLPMFTRVGAAALKNDLSNTLLFCEVLDNPQHKFKTIHIAGTNGKGSTSHMLASILQQAGYKTGLYTSPHLKDFRERIRINGQMISEQEVCSFVESQKENIEKIEPSFFETTVAMAFDFFANHAVDIAIIEVGLGGRLDSTNVVTPIISAITNISFDHVNILGDNLKQIASEKAGIIKPNIPVVIGERIFETENVFLNKAKENNSEICFASDNLKIEHYQLKGNYLCCDVSLHQQLLFKQLNLDLTGTYQLKNILTVLQVVLNLRELGFNIQDEDLYEALQNVKKNTGLQGRWQTLSCEPLVICDTGHNKAGISEVLQNIELTPHHDLHFVIGMVKDKDIDAVLALLPKNATYYFCAPSLERALPSTDLALLASKHQLKGEAYPTVAEALFMAKKNANKNDLIFVGGSTFVVAEVL